MTWNRNTNWSVHITFQAQFRAILHFYVPIGSEDLSALRKLSALHANLPIAKLRELIGNSSYLDLGQLTYYEANELQLKADQLGLSFKIENISFTRYTPVDEENGRPWIIEDEIEAKQIAQEMIAVGATVHYIHSD